MHRDFCGGDSNPGLCDEMDPYDGQLLREYLLRVKFTGESKTLPLFCKFSTQT